MTFKLGDPKPAGSGIKKGQKQNRTVLKEKLLEGGFDYDAELVKLLLTAKETNDADMLWKRMMDIKDNITPKLPAEHKITAEVNNINYAEVLAAHGLTPRTEE